MISKTTSGRGKRPLVLAVASVALIGAGATLNVLPSRPPPDAARVATAIDPELAGSPGDESLTTMPTGGPTNPRIAPMPIPRTPASANAADSSTIRGAAPAPVASNALESPPAARPPSPSVHPPIRELVSLRTPHRVWAGHSAHSNPVSLVPSRTPITRSPTVLPVLARRGRWLKVRLPGRPNGHVGWILRQDTVRVLTDWHLVIDRSSRTLTVNRSGRRIRVFSAIVGRPSTPTPRGEFFVEESIALPAGAAGSPFALALSARSYVLQEFAGGPGQIAVHGVAHIGGVLGTAVSHGCVRLDTAAITWLAHRIGSGVPVTIRA